MTIKVIVELKAKPGGRDELRRLFENMLAQQAPTLSGFLGSTRHEVLDDPDVLVEIADWDSAEARDAHLQEAAATGAFAPLVELLAEPVRAIVLAELPKRVQGDARRFGTSCEERRPVCGHSSSRPG